MFLSRVRAMYGDSISCSEDNRNSAHCPDDANPKYYVQTQEGQLKAVANVSKVV